MNKGSSSFFNIVLLLIIVYAGFVAYSYARINIDAKVFRKAIVEATKGGRELTDGEILDRVMGIADRFRMDVDEDNVYISRDKDNLYIEVKYPIEKNMLFWTLKKQIKITAVSPLDTALD